MNRLSFILFVSIALLIYAALHYYVYRRILIGLPVPGQYVFYLKFIFIFFALTFIAGEFLNRVFSWYFISTIGSTWLGIIAIAFSVFVLKDIVNLILPGRTHTLTVAALIILALISVYSFFNAHRAPDVRELRFKLKKTQGQALPVTIVFISDIHLDGSPFARKLLSSISEKIAIISPDLIFIGGDLIDDDLTKYPVMTEQIKNLPAKYGVFAVTGNHEFYTGVERYEKLGAQTGFTVLRNRRVEAAGIQIIGLDDDAGREFGEGGPDITSAMKDIDRTKPVVCLYHRPARFKALANLGVDLELSGHTHCGQLPPVELFVRLAFRYPCGLRAYKNSFIYTSPGTGIWGPPMRFLSRSEITKIILE